MAEPVNDCFDFQHRPIPVNLPTNEVSSSRFSCAIAPNLPHFRQAVDNFVSCAYISVNFEMNALEQMYLGYIHWDSIGMSGTSAAGIG